jgi:signal transduction histidine kinase/ligand-binding sensor domain-containing protein
MALSWIGRRCPPMTPTKSPLAPVGFRALFGATLLLAWCAALGAQETRPLQSPPEFAIDQWTTEHGLPQNSVNALVQGPDGYLWVGTFGGLARFDGTRFTLVERTDSTGRHIDRVLSLALGPDSALWIGTETGLLRRKHDVYQVFTRANGLPGNEVRALFVDHNGIVWIGMRAGGIAWFSKGRLHALRNVAGHAIGDVTRIVADARGTIWINAGDGVLTIPRGDIRASQWHAAPNTQIELLLHDRHGQSWFGARGRTRSEPAASAARYDVPVAGSVMVESPTGGYWIGTINDGAFFLRTDKGTVETQHYPLADGRRGYRVRSALVDNEGGVWLGTNASGLLRARRNLFTTYRSVHGLSHEVATAVYADRRGTMWVATNCGGVNAINAARQSVRIYNPRLPQDPDGDPCVFALTEDRNGRVWQGSYGGGVTALPTMPGRAREQITGLPDAEVLALFTDRDGTMWVGMRSGGLARVENGRVRMTYTTAHGLADNSVRTIYQARDGSLWIGTLAGLSRLSGGRITTYDATHGLSATHVRAIYEDDAGTIWIGTYGGGLNRFRDGVFTAITRQHGLGDDVVSSILEDQAGNLWMSGNRGIYRVAKKQLNDFADGHSERIHSVLYGRSDGLRNPETNGGFQPASYRDARGHFWFPTVDGVAVVDPARILRNPPTPPVVLEEVVVNGVSQPSQDVVEVGPGRPNIEFRYTGLSLSAPEHLRFRYQLEGYDEGWMEAGARNMAYYPRLPAGNYHFKVQAANRDGEWNTASAGLNLRVVPPLWNTSWFRVLAAMAVLTLVWIWFQRRTAVAHAQRAAQQEFSRRLIESQEQERRRLAGELHDGLGQELLIARNRALMALRGDHQQLNQIVELVTSALAGIRELAHNLTPHQLEHLGITSALQTMVDAVADASGIEIDATIEPIDGLLRSESEINLYRIVQEALNNVVHHAGSRTALVHVRREGAVIRLTLIDHGHGFSIPRDAHELPHGGFGLSSMAERTRILGGTLMIDSEPGRGTVVELSVPVAFEPVKRAPVAVAEKVNV